MVYSKTEDVGYDLKMTLATETITNTSQIFYTEFPKYRAATDRCRTRPWRLAGPHTNAAPKHSIISVSE